MSLARYILIMSVTSAVCWAAWVIVLFYINPTASGFIGLASFYTSMFFALFGTAALIGLILRSLLLRKDPPFHHVGVSLRQALWFALIIVIALMLLANRVFTIWSGLFLVSGMTIIEALFMMRSPSVKRPLASVRV